MKRTTIMLPSKLKARAERLARSQGVSFGKLVRNSLEMQLANANGNGKRDPLFADDFVFDDNLPGDVSENLDKYLHQAIRAERRRWSR